MIIAVDFDGTVVRQNRAYDDVMTPLEFVTGARAGLEALRKAEHTLILCSTRSNLALRLDWRLNPLWASGAVPLNVTAWERNKPLHEARYQQMLNFVAMKLPKIFAAVDDGRQGKLIAALYIDDRSMGLPAHGAGGVDWPAVGKQFGEI
jgi:hypothetical protein